MSDHDDGGPATNYASGTDWTGGPAFPGEGVERVKVGDNLYRHERVSLPGMSLRDYFAAAALAGMIASNRTFVDDHGNRVHDRDTLAYAAFNIADAMLAARRDRKS